MATAKQIEANRRNAQKSTGPTTDDGKDRSRRNALTHGLSGEGIVLPEGDAEAVQERVAQWHSSLRPFDVYQTWLLEVVAVESLRVERCRAQETTIRQEVALRAEESWPEDRRRDAEEISAWRGSNPGLACAKLRSNEAGCRVLLSWWEALGRALEDGWNEPQESLALDLLGIPLALRNGAASPLNEGSGHARTAHRRGIVAAEMDRLQRLLAEVMPARDERERQAAVHGLSTDEGKILARLRRYEGSCMRRLQWARAQIRRPTECHGDFPRYRQSEPRTTQPKRHYVETNPIWRADDANLGDETNPIECTNVQKPSAEIDTFTGLPINFSGDVNMLTDDQIVAAVIRCKERGMFGPPGIRAMDVRAVTVPPVVAPVPEESNFAVAASIPRKNGAALDEALRARRRMPRPKA